jgi:hypothetical protein
LISASSTTAFAEPGSRYFYFIFGRAVGVGNGQFHFVVTGYVGHESRFFLGGIGEGGGAAGGAARKRPAIGKGRALAVFGGGAVEGYRLADLHRLVGAGVGGYFALRTGFIGLGVLGTAREPDQGREQR